MRQKRLIGWILFVIVTFSVFCGFFLVFHKANSREMDEADIVHQKCLELKPGVKFSDLESLFGVGTTSESINGVSRIYFGNNDGNYDWHFLLYSGAVEVQRDDATGEIIELRCGEGSSRWSTRSTGSTVP